MKCVELPFMKKLAVAACVLLIALFPAISQAQNVAVSGAVKTDAGLPISGASITVDGTSLGTTSGTDGSFTISVPAGKTLRISAVGFGVQTFTIKNGQAAIDATLKVADNVLDDIVVVGYGTQRKREVTGSVSSVNLETMANAPNTNIGQYLQGTVPGLNVGLSTFAGGTPPINIRGRVTLGGSQSVVIILDGVQYTNSLSSISPDDIATIDILKDASATAVYGAQGANGVILITSKKGKYNQRPTVSFSTAYTIQNPTGGDDMKPKNRAEFLEGIKEAFWRNTTTPSSTNDAYLAPNYTQPNPAFDVRSKLDALTQQVGYDKGNDFSWYNEATNTGQIFDNHLSLSGGGERVSYFLSGGVINQKGWIINDKFNRRNLRANIEVKPLSWWKVGLLSSGSFVDQDGSEPGFGQINIFSPLLVPYDSLGNVIPSPTNTVLGNPMTSYFVDDRDRQQYYQAIVYNDIDIPGIKGLNYRMNFGQNLRNGQHYYASRFDANQNGRAYKENQSMYDYTFDNILTYKRIFGDHSIGITALYGAIERKYEGTFAEGTGFSRLNLSYNSIQAADQRNTTTAAWSEALNYQMGKLNYSFQGKYLIQGIVRRDGFSGFAENNKYGVFPSVSAGWIISEENFIKNIRSIDFLKLRAGYGVIGNQTQRYSSIAVVNTNSAYVFGDNSTTLFGQQVSALGNDNLKWERTKGLDLGVDFALFNNRLGGNIDYYNNTTTDLLYDVAVPDITGFTLFKTNLGEIHNTGWEVALTGDIVRTRNFKWTASFNIWGNTNKIVRLVGLDANGDGKEDDLISSNLFIGRSIQTIYNYQAGPIYQLNDTRLPGFQVGSLSVVDQDKNGMIDGADRTFIGRQEPAYRMSLYNSLSYKGLTLTFMLNSVQGGKDGYLGNNTRLYFREDNSLRNNELKGVDFWSPSNPNATYPRIVDGTHSTVEPNLYVQRNFVRLQDASLGYTIPARLVSKIKAQTFNIYVSGKNLYTWTDWRGWDPEGLNADGEVQGMITNGRPVLRGFTLGAKVTF